MALEVSIRKKMGDFLLDVHFAGEGKNHIGILGASGCGKSMTLKCIAGIVKPDQGKIILNGKVLFDSEKRINLPPQKRKIGYLFQNYALFPHMTVENNIKIGISNKRYKVPKTNQMLQELISKFHLEGLEGRLPFQLSGGQQQRVALARILANEPDIIMLDEPFSALDSFLKEELQREMVNTLDEYSGEVLMVSHSRDEIYKLTDKLAIMDQGKFITYKDTKNIFQNPEYFEAARLTGCKNISRAEKAGDYMLRANDWNVLLKTAQPVPNDISFVGIRAHHIQILSKNLTESTSENKLSVDVMQKQELPFDINYIVRNVEGSNQEIWIQIPKTDKWGYENHHDLRQEITLPPEALLLLH